MMMDILKYLLCAAAGYLLGSISTGILTARRAGHDIRSEGSQNTGASNALRILGVKGGVIVFIGDFLKAALSVVIGLLLSGHTGGMVAGLAAIIGHNWPLFFGFKGGKGVACSTAVLLILFPLQAGIGAVLCIIVIAVTRYISVGSLTLLISTFLLIMLSSLLPAESFFHQSAWGLSLGFFPHGVWAHTIMVLGFIRHRPNIKRLKAGTENKIGQKAKS